MDTFKAEYLPGAKRVDGMGEEHPEGSYYEFAFERRPDGEVLRVQITEDSAGLLLAELLAVQKG